MSSSKTPLEGQVSDGLTEMKPSSSLESKGGFIAAGDAEHKLGLKTNEPITLSQWYKYSGGSTGGIATPNASFAEIPDFKSYAETATPPKPEPKETS